LKITKNSNDDIFVGTEFDGVNVLYKDSLNWSNISSGLIDLRINNIIFDNAGYAYAATDVGVFKSVNTTTTGINENHIQSSKSFCLSQNFPNPFNPTTTIQYSIPSNVKGEIAKVSLKVYDVLGKEVATLVNEEKPAGSYEVEFSAKGGASSLPSGIYFYKLQTGSYTSVKKMVLIK